MIYVLASILVIRTMIWRREYLRYQGRHHYLIYRTDDLDILQIQYPGTDPTCQYSFTRTKIATSEREKTFTSDT